MKIKCICKEFNDLVETELIRAAENVCAEYVDGVAQMTIFQL